MSYLKNDLYFSGALIRNEIHEEEVIERCLYNIIKDSIQSIKERWESDNIKEIDLTDDTSLTNESIQEKTIEHLESIKYSIEKQIQEKTELLKKEKQEKSNVINELLKESVVETVKIVKNVEKEVKSIENNGEQPKAIRELVKESIKTAKKRTEDFQKKSNLQQKGSSTEDKIIIGDVEVFQTTKSSMYSSDLNDLGIFHINISNDLKHLDRICQLYNLNQRYRLTDPLVIFGLYNVDDYRVLNSHK